MNFTDKEDLREPYSSLTEVLELDEILKLADLWRGRQILFSTSVKDTDTYNELSDTIGAYKADRVINIYMGELVYFPKLKSLSVREQILREFNGYNYTGLARKYGYSERYIRKIVADKSKAIRAICENQTSLFD